MRKRTRRRLGLLGLGMVTLGGAAALVLTALSGDLVFFHSPSELIAHPVAVDTRIRIGGLVELHSVVHPAGTREIGFRITDGKTDVPVVFEGVLPDLFREGQGVVAEGVVRPDGIFAASSVLAKHDEKYMPPEVVEALKRSGHWQEGGKTGMPTAAAAGVPAHEMAAIPVEARR